MKAFSFEIFMSLYKKGHTPVCVLGTSDLNLSFLCPLWTEEGLRLAWKAKEEKYESVIMTDSDGHVMSGKKQVAGLRVKMATKKYSGWIAIHLNDNMEHESSMLYASEEEVRENEPNALLYKRIEWTSYDTLVPFSVR